MTAADANMKRQRWRRLRHWLLLSLALLATLAAAAGLALGGGLLWLDTGPGQRWLVARLNAMLAEDGVVLGRIDGSLYDEVSLDSLRLRDGAGVWLEARDIALTWRPSALLTRKAAIDSVVIGQVTLIRQPDGGADAPAPEDSAWLALPTLPDLPVSLSVDRIDAPTIEISPAAFGQAATVSLNARDIRYAPGIAALNLQLDRRDTDADRVAVDLAFDRAAAQLDLAADIVSAADGLLAGIAGARDGETVDVHLSGAGPLDDWSGRLEASRGADLGLQAELRYRDSVLLVESTATIAALLAPDMQQRLGRSATISLTAPLNRRPALPLDVEISMDAGEFALDGEMAFADPDPTLDFTWRADLARALSIPEQAIHLGAAQASGRLGGTVSAPAIETEIALSDARLPGSVAAASLRLQANGVWNGRTLDMQAAAQAAPLAVEGLEPFPLDVRLSGRYAAGEALIVLSDWRLEGGGATVSGSGRYGLESGALAVDARIERLALAALPVAIPVSGNLTGTAALDRPDATSPLILTTGLTGQAFSSPDPALDDLIGAAPRLDAALTLQDDTLRLDSVTLNAAHALLEASGDVGLGSFELTLDYRLALDDLAQLYPVAEAQTGALAITGRVEGTPDDLRATARSRLDEVTLQGVRLSEIDLSATGANLTGQPRLTADLTAQSNLGPLESRLEAAMVDDGGIDVPALSFALGRLSASGALRIADSGLAAGRISGRIVEADAQAGPSAIAGSGAFALDLADESGAQALQITAGGQDLRFDPVRGAVFTVESLDLEGDLRFADGGPAGSLRLEILNADRGFSRLSRLLMTAEGAEAGAIITAAAEGDWRGPLDLEATVEAHGLGTRPDLFLTTAGEIFGLAIETAMPMRVQRRPEGWALTDLDLRLGEGRLTGAAHTGATDAALRLDASGLPLELLSAALPSLAPSGRFDLTVDLAQSGKTAGGAAALKVEGLSPLAPGLVDTPAVDLVLDATLQDARLALTGTAEGETGLSANMSAELPFALDLVAGGMEMSPDADIAASMDWRGDIAPLFMSLDLPTHEAQGRMEAKVRATGTLAAPRLDGRLRLENGRYEHLDSGFLADDLSLTLTLDNDRIALEDLAAGDGGGGRLSGSGDALWRDSGLAQADLTLKLEQMALVRRSDATATVSAEIAYRRADGESVISGSIRPDRAEVSIARNLPDDIQTIDVVELDPRENEGPRQRDDMRLRNLPTRLDLSVMARNRLFVRGRGLDSEWRSDLDISGTTDAPRIQGTARLVKGVFDFAGHRFTLDEGELLFAGGSRIDPDIRIVASETVDGTDFRITVTGPASAPRIALSSTPSLPEDEILARLLFGESVGNLSALEAVQLASALSSLSGGDGNFDLVGKLRGTLGLDRLTVDLGGENGGATVSGGKYLTDDVYFEVAADTASGETRGIVNWDLTRNLNLRGTVASSRDSTISLRWRWSY